MTMPGQQGQGFKVKIRVRNPDDLAIRPEMTCRAEIHTQSASQTLAVPVGAVLFKQGGKAEKSLYGSQGAYVFVDKDGKAERHKVALGISSDSWQVIKSGLKRGEKVITGPYEVLHSLTAGADVAGKSAPEAPGG